MTSKIIIPKNSFEGIGRNIVFYTIYVQQRLGTNTIIKKLVLIHNK